MSNTNTQALALSTPETLEDENALVLCSPEAFASLDAEEQDFLSRKGSVVKKGYKVRYANRAVASGNNHKAARRSTWDWLAIEIAAECLDDKAKLRVGDFLALLEANGVDHSRWTNRSPGWEGRLRMTGRLALQKVVAEAGLLRFPDGEEKEPTSEWLAKFA